MTDRVERVVQAARVIKEFLTDQAGRIRYGMRARRLILKQMHHDQPATGPRVEWLHATVPRVMDALKQASHEYGSRYPWDAISYLDLQDVLRSCLAQIEDSE